MDTLYCGLSPKSPNLFPFFTLNETFIKRTPLLSGRGHLKSTWNGHYYCCQNSTTQHARHRKCECYPQFFRFLQNVTWRTYLISLTVKYFSLFRFVCIELVSLIWFLQIWETFINRENCLHKNPQHCHKSARGPHRRYVTHILSKVSCFLLKSFHFRRLQKR